MAQRIKDETPEEQNKKEKTERKKEEKKDEKKETKEHITSLVRIMSTDIPGNKKVCYGLTRIKGISFSFANAVCNSLRISSDRKISSLAEDEIGKITNFVNNPKLPPFMMNRRRDIETGNDKHLTLTNLDFQKESDIKKLRKIKSYRGWRHAIGQPVRGQRTRSHFRHGKSVGVLKVKQKPGEVKKEEKGKK